MRWWKRRVGRHLHFSLHQRPAAESKWHFVQASGRSCHVRGGIWASRLGPRRRIDSCSLFGCPSRNSRLPTMRVQLRRWWFPNRRQAIQTKTVSRSLFPTQSIIRTRTVQNLRMPRNSMTRQLKMAKEGGGLRTPTAQFIDSVPRATARPTGTDRRRVAIQSEWTTSRAKLGALSNDDRQPS